MKNTERILRKAMSAEYCGATYFDFLDEEEVSMILKAMSEISKINTTKKILLSFLEYIEDRCGEMSSSEEKSKVVSSFLNDNQ